MRDEKSLDEALDEMDRWGDRVGESIKDLSPEQVTDYFRQAQARLEQKTGKKLNLPPRSMPQATGPC